MARSRGRRRGVGTRAIVHSVKASCTGFALNAFGSCTAPSIAGVASRARVIRVDTRSANSSVEAAGPRHGVTRETSVTARRLSRMPNEMPEVRRIDPPDIPLPADAAVVDVLVLPREVDAEGRGIYHDSAITAVKEFAPTGVTASYAHPKEERFWYGEKSYAKDVIDWVIGIASNGGWAALCWVLRRDHGSAHVRVKVARCRQTADETTWEWYEIQGRGTAVADALAALELAEEAPVGIQEELEEETEA